MALVYIITSSLSVALWLPILIQFMRSWRSRGNPISLAICAAITLIMWTSLAGIWLVTDRITGHIFVLATAGASTLVASYAHLAFIWSNRRFHSQRGSQS